MACHDRTIDDYMAQMGMQLHNTRTIAGLSDVTVVAKRAGVPRVLVNRVELGDPSVQAAELIAIALALDMTVHIQPQRPANKGEQAALDQIERLRPPPGRPNDG